MSELFNLLQRLRPVAPVAAVLRIQLFQRLRRFVPPVAQQGFLPADARQLRAGRQGLPPLQMAAQRGQRQIAGQQQTLQCPQAGLQRPMGESEPGQLAPILFAQRRVAVVARDRQREFNTLPQPGPVARQMLVRRVPQRLSLLAQGKIAIAV